MMVCQQASSVRLPAFGGKCYLAMKTVTNSLCPTENNACDLTPKTEFLSNLQNMNDSATKQP